MRIVFFFRQEPKVFSAPGMQVFIDGVLHKVVSIDEIWEDCKGGWVCGRRAFVIPDVPEDAVELKDGHLRIHEPTRDRAVID